MRYRIAFLTIIMCLFAVSVSFSGTKISEMTFAQRAQLPGVSTGRVEQLVAGAIVAQEAMEFLGLTVLEVCPWALREGLILRRLDWFPDDA